jgi:CheY-like chemotaxis protein
MSEPKPEPPARLLVVDGDQAMRTLIKAIFQRRSVTVECAGDGEAALDRLRRSRFDVMVLDLILPGPSGLEIIRELKSRDRALLSHTIVLTAASRAMLRDFADAPLVRRVMYKPFDLDELVTEVLSLTPAVFDHHIALQTEEHVH